MPLQEEFQQALLKGMRLSKKADKKTRDRLDALCKQATVGDVRGDKPGFFDFAGKATYKAWADLAGVSQEEAMRRYIAAVRELTPP
ncbi:MAG: acyl-CoA-binding protein [Myxococcota bacterium]